jgi:hypothetical protein
MQYAAPELSSERTGGVEGLLSKLRFMRMYRGIRLLSDGREPIHFLHISKTGGTNLVNSLEKANASQERYFFIKHSHDTRLSDIPKNQRYFFSVRDPISRFVSGFYSRQRKGKPRHVKEHTAEERLAFAQFTTPNELAAALQPDHSKNREAVKAMNAIGHTRRHMFHTFGDSYDFLSLRPPLMVLRQEHLSEDVISLFCSLGINIDPTLSTDPRVVHSNNYDALSFIPLTAIESSNVRMWFSRDYELLSAIDETIGLGPQSTS